jgi:hypothetical protein
MDVGAWMGWEKEPFCRESDVATHYPATPSGLNIT